MFYIVYVCVFVVYLLYGIGIERGITDFVDTITFIYVLAPSVLMLFCTRSFKDFGCAVLFAFGKKDISFSQCEKSLQAVKMVLITILLAGGVCFSISIINCLRSINWVTFEDLGWTVLNISVAMISVFYPMVLCLLLLPVYYLLKKEIKE